MGANRGNLDVPSRVVHGGGLDIRQEGSRHPLSVAANYDVTMVFCNCGEIVSQKSRKRPRNTARKRQSARTEMPSDLRIRVLEWT